MLTLLGPFTPMLFQGEEWAASTPFQFFTSHPEPELGEAVRNGRRAEFASHGWGESEVPDPQDPATFLRSKLDWDELDSGRHAVVLAAYQELGRLRRSLPDLTDPSFVSVSCTVEGRVLTLRRGDLVLAVNVGTTPAEVGVEGPHAVLFSTPTAGVVDGSTLRLPAHAGVLLGPA